MGHVDLDALAAARAEALNEPNTVTFKGREYKLVNELTIDAVLAYRRMFRRSDTPDDDIDGAREFVRLVIADATEADDFWSQHPTWADLDALFGVYLRKPEDMGESSASQPSSPKGGKRARLTSPRSTT